MYGWECTGSDGGSTVVCAAEEDRCGDTSINTGVYTNNASVQETCDDGNTLDGDGCDSACESELSCADLDLRIETVFPNGRTQPLPDEQFHL